MDPAAPFEAPTRFRFVLAGGYSLSAAAPAIDALRIANDVLGRDAFGWSAVLPPRRGEPGDRGPVLAATPGDTPPAPAAEALVLCGGRNISARELDDLGGWLRRACPPEAVVGALGTGVRVLARAGLLDGYRCSVLADDLPALREVFPSVTFETSNYTIDRNRFTCTGGVASVGLIIEIVRRHLDASLAGAVADRVLAELGPDTRDAAGSQLRIAAHEPSAKLLGAMELMAANVRHPLDLTVLAGQVGLSRRQLQRLYQKYLLCSPSRYYLNLRLQRARDLLQLTRLPLGEIAARTGFVALSHFSKAYKTHFGHSPSAERGRRRQTRLDVADFEESVARLHTVADDDEPTTGRGLSDSVALNTPWIDPWIDS